jgi:hypothetical protein
VFRDQFGLVQGQTCNPSDSAGPLEALPVRPQAIACRWAGEPADLDHITSSLYNRPGASARASPATD